MQFTFGLCGPMRLTPRQAVVIDKASTIRINPPIFFSDFFNVCAGEILTKEQCEFFL